MDWKKGLRSLLGRVDAGRRESHARLRLERLEERCLLSLVDLGTLGGTNSVATAINASGEVAGDSTTASSETHAFLDHVRCFRNPKEDRYRPPPRPSGREGTRGGRGNPRRRSPRARKKD